MTRQSFFDCLNSYENLELRLSMTAIVVPAVSPPPADDGDVPPGNDPLPNPEPPPPYDPGPNPPIVYPVIPTSGPPGPGS
jgi:hypothetical protein